MKMPITAESVYNTIVFDLYKESDCKNLIANISTDIIKACFKKKFYIATPQINIGYGLKTAVFDSLKEAGFKIAETTEMIYIFWCTEELILEFMKEDDIPKDIKPINFTLDT